MQNSPLQPSQARVLISLFLLSLLISASLFPKEKKAPYSGVPAEQKTRLEKRLPEYVSAYRTRDWSSLYDLISDTAKGGVARTTFISKMNTEHREEFSSFPDLFEFDADHMVSDGENEYDIYGCGKARRERNNFNGVALVHAVFEHKDWYFSGWSFTEFPNEPCKRLKDPSWKPPAPMEWGMPMGELRK
jgi:hypothetical protein